jgi:hypothetical protein
MSIAPTEFIFLRCGLVIARMQTIDETRRQRLKMLIDKHGSIAALNELLGLSRTDATLSQIKNRSVHSKTGTPRAMGDPMARKIEAALNLPDGWMDTPPTYTEMHGLEDPRATVLQAMEHMTISQIGTAAALIKALAQTQTQTQTQNK